MSDFFNSQNPMFIMLLASIGPIVIAMVHAHYYAKKVRRLEREGKINSNAKKQ